MKKFNKPISLENYRKSRLQLKNVDQDVKESFSRLDKFAIWITEKIGTIGFFLIIVLWTFVWLGWNIFVPEKYQFDPYPAFVLWLFISNMIQIFLMPLLLIGQNIQGKHSEARSEHDLEVNIKAEKEIELVLGHLEYQNSILIAMLEKMGLDIEKFIKK